ncbi:MAG: hypothetical protein NTY08_12710 [Proteobacteria bacterium]|nr:hypothetical protein [Pseudomonadota bacterium]
MFHSLGNCRLRLVAATLTLLSSVATTSLTASPSAGIFSNLQMGESVSIKEVGEKYDISRIPGLPQLYKVTAIGADYIELTMPSMVLRIPVYAVRSITTFKN